MWSTLALFVIKQRRILILLMAAMTVFMAWKAKDVEMTYDFAQVVSPNDPDMVYFQQFKQTFGEDGNVLVLGLQDSSVYKLGNFNELRNLTDTLTKVEGVNGVLSRHTSLCLAQRHRHSAVQGRAHFPKRPRKPNASWTSLMRVVNRRGVLQRPAHLAHYGGHAAGPHHGPQVPEFLAPAGRDERYFGPRGGVQQENRHPVALRGPALRALHHDHESGGRNEVFRAAHRGHDGCSRCLCSSERGRRWCSRYS